MSQYCFCIRETVRILEASRREVNYQVKPDCLNGYFKVKADAFCRDFGMAA